MILISSGLIDGKFTVTESWRVTRVNRYVAVLEEFNTGDLVNPAR